MKIFPQAHHRRSIRLKEYDYSQPGAYFITVVAWQRQSLFGQIVNGKMSFHAAGQVVWETWNSLPVRFPQISLGPAVVMPNHFHGIVIINPPVGAIHELPLRVQLPPRIEIPIPAVEPRTPPPALAHQKQRRRMTLPLVVGYFKMNSAKRINQLLGSPGIPVWQRNYYEHVIRDEGEMERIRSYIEMNVQNWEHDEEKTNTGYIR